MQKHLIFSFQDLEEQLEEEEAARQKLQIEKVIFEKVVPDPAFEPLFRFRIRRIRMFLDVLDPDP